MEPETKKSKKIDISSSSLVALKAELLNKQDEVRRAKSATGDGTLGPIKKRLPGIRKPERAPTESKNKGVESRAKMDEEQHQQETKSLDRSRQILEEKAKLYEKLTKDRSLLEEDTITEEQTHFLVDFQQKVVENVRKELDKRRTFNLVRKDESDDDTPANEDDYQAQSDGEEWVDFVDSFGRTRRCQKKDLPEFQERDRQIDPKQPEYSNFVKASGGDNDESEEATAEAERKKQMRQQWEQDEEINRSKSSLHYQDVLFQEARQHGAGFYTFARDEEVRAEQMSQLERMRQQTEAARSQQAASSAKKQSALQARLLKVKQKKRAKLGLPALDEKEALASIGAQVEPEPVIGPPPPMAEAAPDDTVKTRPPSLPQSVRIRPWDLGKEGMPKSQPVLTQTTWVEKKREERVSEFAPPPTYADSNRPPSVRNRQGGRPPRQEATAGASSEPEPQLTSILTEDSISAGLAFIKQQTSRVEFRAQSPEQPVPGHDLSEEQEEAEMSTSQSARWRPKPSRVPVADLRQGTEIPPPPSMDYYVDGNAHRRGAPSTQSSNVSQSMQMGMLSSGSLTSHSSCEKAVDQRWNFYGP